MKHCRHFNGVLRGTCRAGVVFDTVPRVPCEGINLPCLRKEGGDYCPDHSPFTAEEVAADNAAMLEVSTRLTNCRDAIAAHFKTTKKASGTIECPACGTSLRYSIAPNGHIAARCQTAGCCSFIE